MSDHGGTRSPTSDPTEDALTTKNSSASDLPSTTHIFSPVFWGPAAAILPQRAHGRPCKHHTPEEQAAAHAVSQQAYYERCVSFSVSLRALTLFYSNRDTLCRQGRRRYADRNGNTERSRRNVIASQPRRTQAHGTTTERVLFLFVYL